MPWVEIVAIGTVVGFLGGLFGKGGSALATPLLAAVGVPPIIAVASPLPATVPGTLIAHREYRRFGLSDPEVIRWSIAVGVPATVARRRPHHLDRRRRAREGHRRRGRPARAAVAPVPPGPRGRARRPRPPAPAPRAHRGRRRPAVGPAGQRGRLPASAPVPGRPAAPDQDGPGLLARRGGRPRRARHHRARDPRPHRLGRHRRVRRRVDPACRGSAPARPCACTPPASSGSTAPGCWCSAPSCSSPGDRRPPAHPGEGRLGAAAGFSAARRRGRRRWPPGWCPRPPGQGRPARPSVARKTQRCGAPTGGG